MNHILSIKNTVCTIIAGAGSVIAALLGGWDAALQVLIALMVADYVTGLLVAGVFNRSGKSDSGALSSQAGFKGIVKKCVVLLLIWLAVLLDNAIGAAYVRTAVILFFIGNEGLSLLENIGLMGVPYPAFLQKALESMRDKGNEGNKQ